MVYPSFLDWTSLPVGRTVVVRVLLTMSFPLLLSFLPFVVSPFNVFRWLIMLFLAFLFAFHPILPCPWFARLVPSPFLPSFITLRVMVSSLLITLGDFYHPLVLMTHWLPQTCSIRLPLPYGILLSFLFPTVPLSLSQLTVGIPVL